MAAVDVGAVTFENQAEIIEDHVKDARRQGREGARPAASAARAQGRFFEPTVLVDVDHSMKIMTEETFGPTLPIMKVRDEEEAVEKANDSRYGLNSSVLTKDVEKGERIARRIEAGSTCVNDCITNYAAQELPFGGVKESGHRRAPLGGRDPEVLQPARDPDHPLRGQARAVLLPVLEARDASCSSA